MCTCTQRIIKLVYVQDRHSVEYLMLDCYKIDGNFKTRFGKKILKKKDVLCCRIYLNDKFFGKIDASTKMDRQGYQYVITGLNPEESYDVKVKV